MSHHGQEDATWIPSCGSCLMCGSAQDVTASGTSAGPSTKVENGIDAL